MTPERVGARPTEPATTERPTAQTPRRREIWHEQWNVQPPNAGDFTLTFTSATPVTSDAGAAYDVHGTLTATMLADTADSPATGTVNGSVTF